MKNENEGYFSPKFRSTIVIVIIIMIGAIIITNTISNSKYKMKELELLKKEEQENIRQRELEECFRIAKNDRRALWNANCPEDNPDCSLNQSTIKWIDSRYEQDIKNCNTLYK